ncbi:phage terminase Nu1 subunit (DNA packaging protein) [Xanthobacter sp. SG618]|uniref:type IV toxin-antitoxin system AbiEi family antitoxin domain-containing protein n=1 Tax=Xanthobacter sp. SG618 TaxID=2587121 RepID=UPI00145C4C77|nr:type IV toxin-antitoxin system AbiEi family antitoxin domain-containing protein [Xanthobacter sp. SG618]NMN57841.1 phage terminase Nu1 subunit (DNA packaging protein) [Xanthobacter sp. SG618]
MTETLFTNELTADQLAAFLGVTPKTIRNHAERGVVVRSGRGKYLLAESIRNMLAEARKGSRTNDLHREQLALVREKRRAAELRNAEAEGRVIDLTEAEAVVDAIVATFRVGLDSLPAKTTRDVSLRKAIKAEADAILLAASRKFAALAGTHNNETMMETDNDE